MVPHFAFGNLDLNNAIFSIVSHEEGDYHVGPRGLSESRPPETILMRRWPKATTQGIENSKHPWLMYKDKGMEDAFMRYVSVDGKFETLSRVFELYLLAGTMAIIEFIARKEMQLMPILLTLCAFGSLCYASLKLTERSFATYTMDAKRLRASARSSTTGIPSALDGSYRSTGSDNNPREVSIATADMYVKFAHRFERIAFLSVYIPVFFASAVAYPYRSTCHESAIVAIDAPDEVNQDLVCNHIVYVYALACLVLTAHVQIPRTLFSTVGILLGLILLFSLRPFKPLEDNDRQLASQVILQLYLNFFFMTIRATNEYFLRKQFETFLRVETSLEEMEVVQEEHTRFCDTIIPPALRPRLLANNALIDVASSACCVIIDIPNFGMIRNAAMLPGTSAMLLAKLQELLTSQCCRSADGPGVHRGASLGDMFIGVCNLLCVCDYYTLEALAFVTNVANSYASVVRRVTDASIPLRYGIGQGMTVGAVTSTALVHYDLLGENVLATKRLLLQLKENEVGLTETAQAGMMSHFDALHEKVNGINKQREEHEEKGHDSQRDNISEISNVSVHDDPQSFSLVGVISKDEVSALFTDRPWNMVTEETAERNESASFRRYFMTERVGELSKIMSRYERSVIVVRQEELNSSSDTSSIPPVRQLSGKKTSYHHHHVMCANQHGTSLRGGERHLLFTPFSNGNTSLSQQQGNNLPMSLSPFLPPSNPATNNNNNNNRSEMLLVSDARMRQENTNGNSSGFVRSENDDHADKDAKPNLGVSCAGLGSSFHLPCDEETFKAFREWDTSVIVRNGMFFFASMTFLVICMHAMEVPDEFTDASTKKSVWIGVGILLGAMIGFVTIGLLVRTVFPEVDVNVVVVRRTALMFDTVKEELSSDFDGTGASDTGSSLYVSQRLCHRSSLRKRCVLYALIFVCPILLFIGAVNLNKAPYYSLATNDTEYLWMIWSVAVSFMPLPPTWLCIVPVVAVQYLVWLYSMTVGEMGVMRRLAIVTSPLFCILAVVVFLLRATENRKKFLMLQQMHGNANAIHEESDRRLKIMKTVIPGFLMSAAASKELNGVVYVHRDFVIVMLRFDDFFVGAETASPDTFKSSMPGGGSTVFVRSNELGSSDQAVERNSRGSDDTPECDGGGGIDPKEQLRAVQRSLRAGDRILKQLPKDTSITMGKAFGDTWLLLGGVKDTKEKGKRRDMSMREAAADVCSILWHLLLVDDRGSIEGGKPDAAMDDVAKKVSASSAPPPPCVTVACVFDSSICVVLGGLYSTFEIAGPAVTTGRVLLDAAPRGSKVVTERFHAYYSILREDQERYNLGDLHDDAGVSDNKNQNHLRSDKVAVGGATKQSEARISNGSDDRWDALRAVGFTDPRIWHLRSLGRQGVHYAKLL